VKCVLLIDDDPDLRKLLRTTLETDYRVLEAFDGVSGLRLAQSEVPDIVVLDWQMPGKWGGDVLAELKRRTPHLPVVVLTAHQSPSTEIIAAGLEASAFLRKPFSPLELAGVLDRVLGETAAPPAE
jgi:DNA-binding response OmpR family regulator